MAEKVRKTLRFRFDWEGHSFELTGSIGVIAITPDSTNAADVLRAVDAACYRAKREGRNRVFVQREPLLTLRSTAPIGREAER